MRGNYSYLYQISIVGSLEALKRQAKTGEKSNHDLSKKRISTEQME